MDYTPIHTTGGADGEEAHAQTEAQAQAAPEAGDALLVSALTAPLSEQERNFALLLAEGQGTSEAGRAVGISTATAYRWVKNPAILEIVAQAQADVRNELLRRLFGLGVKALRAYEDALDGKDVLATRKASADAVLDRIGLSKEQIVKHVGSSDAPIVVEFKVPFNVNARDEQEERRRRRQAAQEIEAEYTVQRE